MGLVIRFGKVTFREVLINSIFVLMSVFFSCNSPVLSQNDESIEAQEDVIRIDLNQSEIGKFSDLFDSVRYVLLEEDANIPLVRVFKTIVYEENVYVSDIHLNNLFKFDLEGRVLNILESGGVGPREFSGIEDFQVVGDTVIVLDSRLRKIISFDQENNFLREVRLKYNVSNFYRYRNFNVFYKFDFSNSESYPFVKISDNNEESKYLYKSTEGGFAKVRLLHGFVKNSLSDIFITIPFSYKVAKFNNSGELVGLNEFEFLNKPDNQEISGQIEIVNSFIPYPNFNFMTVYFGRNGYQILMDKDFHQIYLGKNLENDLDGLNYYLLPISYNSDYLVLYFPSIDLWNLYDQSKDRLISEFPQGSIHDFVDSRGDELKNDRHVLVFLRIKESLFSR